MERRPVVQPSLAIAAVTALLLGAPAVAGARGGSDDGGGGGQRVRVSGHCGKGATSKLSLKADDGALEVEFEVDRNRNGERWRVTLVRERRVVVRTTAHTRAPSGSFSVERRLRDLAGADRVTARAVGPRGLTCEATATLRG
ncbi:MAG: hypothetical protein JWP18_2014 [Solirubrobacterales bacterium]|jgi:hypothetical protein|nr:hypothetical protein [Solirubrobacterales bacterium]